MAENIKVIIRERRAQVDGGPVIVCGNSDYTITFDFDSDWNLTGPKTARFVYVKDGEVLHEDKVFSGKTVAVPVLSDVSFVDVGVFAGDLCTTTPARIRCKRSILCGSGEVHEPTPDVYAQIMALFNEMAEQGAFGATEAQAQQIEANKQNITKLTNGTTPAGKATDAAQLGGETALQWQEKIDNIQTASRAILSQAGWYRVAEFQGDQYSAKGSSANGCTILIKRTYAKQKNETYRILLDSNFNKQEFNVQSAIANVQAITKIRYTYDTTTYKAYIEIYYNANVADYVRVLITDLLDSGNVGKSKWVCINGFEPTSETVSGVTVTTTYDIPANASPVTDLDLVRFGGTEALNTSVLDKAIELPNGIYTYRLGGSAYTGGDLPSNYIYSIARIEKRASTEITVTLSGVAIGATASADYPPIYNHYYGSGWVGWKTFATTADLANYFKNTGGKVKGSIYANSDGAEQRVMYVENSLRRGGIVVESGGLLAFRDGTNSQDVFISTTDGANTFNGTATGNLRLSGGGELTLDKHKLVLNGTHNELFKLNNAGDEPQSNFVGYYLNNDFQGKIGFRCTTPVVMCNGSNEQELLHTGNSAKVAIQSTAPTDGLWVW